MERSVLDTRHVHWASNLHSEYRSTYRWHEYKGGAGAAAAGGAGGGVVRQPAPAPASSLPHNRDMFTGPVEPAMPRRKKYPGVAYKSNDLFDPSAAPEHERLKSVATSTLDRARSVERNDSRPGAGRRSKSEGPRQPRWTDTVEAKGTATGTGLGEVLATKEPPETSTEYRNQFAWPKDSAETGAPRKSTSMGTLKLGAGKRKPVAGDGTTEMEPLMNHTEDSNVNEEHASKKYIEDYLWNGHKPGVPRKSTFRNALSAFISNGEDRSKDNRKRYKSEYKKKFRPFSQYVYEASKGTFTKCRGLKGKAGSLEREEGSTERMLPAQQQARARDAPDAPHATNAAHDVALKDGDSWYREVLDLRKRAGEYKYRGWGTELAPEHITQLYDKQIELWYQVSRRSSLSALSLAATNHKALPSGEKEAADARSRSPKKVRSFLNSGPHQSIHAKLSETRQSDRTSQKTSPQKVQRKKLQGHSFDETAAPNEGKASVNKRGLDKDGKRASPRKELNIVVGAPTKEFRSPRRRPRSADPKPAVQPVLNGHEPPKPHKPTGLPLNSRVKSTTKKTTAKTPSPTSATANNASRRSRSVSKVGIKLDDEAPPSLRSASVAKDHVFDDTPVVKSPPEPTRVKSPEQMNMRSPDPVNWTVPLDTGKTFTVTQNVKNDDNIKRPSSEFKATSIFEDVTAEATEGVVEGTVVAQGEELVPVHHQLSPIRTLKKSDSPTGVHKRSDAYNKTPTSPASLTPIDETKTLDITRPITNGSCSTQPSPADNPKLSPTDSITSKTPDNPIASKYAEIAAELTKKPTEATQKATGVVDTSVVNENTSAYTAAEVLDRARNRFDKFWGKKEEDNV